MQSNHDEQLLAGIIKKLEKGVPPWRQPWTDASNYALIGGNKHFGNSWPSNVRAPKVPFGVYNGVMLLMAANIDGYKTNLWIAQKAVKELGAELDPPKSAPRKIRAHFNGTDSTVYNIEQVKDYESVLGLSLKIEKSDIEVQHKKSEKLLEKLKDQKGLCVKHGQDRAFYNSSSDIIGMPEVSQFLKVDKKNGESFYWATLWHETVHWTGASRRLARQFGGHFGDDDYAFEELVAELGATFLCSQLQINADFQNASYIASWLRGQSKSMEESTAERMKDFAQLLRCKRNKRNILREAGEKASAAKDFILRSDKSPKDAQSNV